MVKVNIFNKRAFTLIELLVVISIIVVLMSILMPALGKVRQQAKLTIDQVNIKQLGTYVALYQADNNNEVPVMLNVWAMGASGVTIPVKATNLSVALRAYTSGSQLPADLNPNENWTMNQLEEYYTKYLPQEFMCPFIRGKDYKGEMFKKSGMISLSKGSNSKNYMTWKLDDGMESYGTWLWSKEKGQVIDPDNPLGMPNGVRKYGQINWYNTQSVTSDGPLRGYDKLSAAKWSSRDVKLTKAAGMADASVLSCIAGESLVWAGGFSSTGIYNYGSHKKGNKGGTMLLFADLHAGWCPGMEVGDTGQ